MKSIIQINEERNEKALIQLQDCSVVEISEDSFGWQGCETCDYGSEYGVEYVIEFSDGEKFEFKFSEMYETPISEGEMMMFILNNLDELKTKTKEEFKLIICDENEVLGK